MKRNEQPKVGAIIAAAGESKRMGGTDKLLAKIGGELLLTRAVRPFQECHLVSQIVVVVSAKNQKQCRHLVMGEAWSKVSDICLGGRRRQDSVAAGLSHLNQCDWIIIHDGARPLITVDLIERGLEAARETGAAIAAVPVTDTIKIAGDDRIVHRTLPRHSLWAVQTPQVFRYDMINEVYRQKTSDATDDASLVEQLGYKVKLYMGSYENIKVTTPVDLALAELIWKKHEH